MSHHHFWVKNRSKVSYREQQIASEKPEKKSSFTFFSSINKFLQPDFSEENKPNKFSDSKNLIEIITTPFSKDHKLKGIYLWGNTGTGKTQFLNLFYETLDIEEKIFIHFNKFML